jgi:hypothetical protein
LTGTFKNCSLAEKFSDLADHAKNTLLNLQICTFYYCSVSAIYFLPSKLVLHYHIRVTVAGLETDETDHTVNVIVHVAPARCWNKPPLCTFGWSTEC